MIGKSIKQPEVSEMIDVLIKAINDPFYQNRKGLNIILKSEFHHYLDVPALSMIVPIIDYGLVCKDDAFKE